MSYSDLSKANATELVSQYIIEYRGKGHFLPYQDYNIIRSWLKRVHSSDDLLLVLSEIIPEYYQKHADKTHPPSLAKIRKQVERRLREFYNR